MRLLSTESNIWTPGRLYSFQNRDLGVTERGEQRRGPLSLAFADPVDATGSRRVNFYVRWVALETPDGYFLEDESNEPRGRLAYICSTETMGRVVFEEDGSIRFRNVVIFPKGDNLQKPRFRFREHPLYAAQQQEDW